jgi:hypothetical protein
MKPSTVALFVLIFAFHCGCSTRQVGRAATKTVSFAGKTVAKTTITAVKTGGTVAMSATKTAAKTTSHVITEVARAGFVTITDITTGISKQIPYSEGMRLYAATKTAELDTYMKGFEILRAGMAIRTDWQKIKTVTGNPELKPGDVIQVKRLAESAAKNLKRS